MTPTGKAQTGGTPQAFVWLDVTNFPPTQNDDSPTTYSLFFDFLVGDGSAPPVSTGVNYVYDTTLGSATNIANIKAAVVAAAAAFNFTLTTSNVTLLFTVN